MVVSTEPNTRLSSTAKDHLLVSMVKVRPHIQAHTDKVHQLVSTAKVRPLQDSEDTGAEVTLVDHRHRRDTDTVRSHLKGSTLAMAKDPHRTSSLPGVDIGSIEHVRKS